MEQLRRLIRLRFFLFALVRNDLNNRYRRSVLGIAWSLARPIGMTVVFCLVFTGMFGMELRDYAPFLFLGFAVWQFLVEAMSGGCRTFLSGATYIRQQPMPLILFPLRSVLVSGFHTGVALLVALGLTWWCVGLPSVLVLLSVLPALVLIFSLGLSLATLCGALHTHFPDTQHMLEIVLQALFYLTPVMYPPSAFHRNPLISGMMALNPFASVLELIRRPLLSGEFAGAGPWMVALVFVAAVGTCAFAVLRRVERELVFWV